MYTEKHIRQFDLHDIEFLFEQIERRRNFYLEQPVIEELIGFINGYVMSYTFKKASNDNPWFIFENFKGWLMQKYPDEYNNSNSSVSLLMNLITKDKEVTAYEQFWIEWKLFCEVRPWIKGVGNK